MQLEWPDLSSYVQPGAQLLSTQPFPGLKEEGGETDRSQHHFLLQWVTSDGASPSGKELRERGQGTPWGAQSASAGMWPPASGGKQLERQEAVPGKSPHLLRAGKEVEAGSRKARLGLCRPLPQPVSWDDRGWGLDAASLALCDLLGNSVQIARDISALSMRQHTSAFPCVWDSRG